MQHGVCPDYAMRKDILHLYKGLPPVAKASLWFMVCTMLQKCLSLVTTPIFTRIMDAEQYGYFSTYLSLLTILPVLLTLNFDTGAYANGITKLDDENDVDQLGTSLLALSFIITAAFGVIAFFAREFLADWLALPASILLLLVLEILFLPPLRFWMLKQRFAYKYVSVVAVILGMLVVNNALGILVVLAFPATQAVMRVLAITVVQVLVGIPLYGLYLKKSGLKNLTRFWKYGLRLNLPLVPHSLSIHVMASSDKVMINAMIGAVQAGIYGVANSVGHLMTAFKLSLVEALRPWVYEKLKSRDFAEIRSVCQVLFIANVVISFLMVGLAPEIVAVLAPQKYHQAIYVIPPVAASGFFSFVYNTCSLVEMYYERTKSVMVASVVSAALNVGLNFAFIPKFGFLAAGYTTLVSCAFLSAMHFFIVCRIQREEMDNARVIGKGPTLLLAGLTIAVMIVFTVLYAHPALRWCAVVALASICWMGRKKFMDIHRALRSAKKRQTVVVAGKQGEGGTS